MFCFSVDIDDDDPINHFLFWLLLSQFHMIIIIMGNLVWPTTRKKPIHFQIFFCYSTIKIWSIVLFIIIYLLLIYSWTMMIWPCPIFVRVSVFVKVEYFDNFWFSTDMLLFFRYISLFFHSWEREREKNTKFVLGSHCILSAITITV